MTYNQRSRLLRQKGMLPVPIAILAFCQVLAQADGAYWDKNVAILEVRIRTVSASAYVREIVMRDFDGSQPLNPDFGFGSDLFVDTGQGFDLAAGDGIYTSERCYAHTSGTPFVELNYLKSALRNTIIDTEFRFVDQLDNWLTSQMALPAPTKILECNLKFCPCPDPCLCFACEWSSSTWCLDWCNCKTELVLDW